MKTFCALRLGSAFPHIAGNVWLQCGNTAGASAKCVVVSAASSYRCFRNSVRMCAPGWYAVDSVIIICTCA